jgi:hypothetical protein
MEIDENRQYFQLPLTLIDFLRVWLFFIAIDINLFILLSTITDNYSCQSIPIDYPIYSLRLHLSEPKDKKKHKSVIWNESVEVSETKARESQDFEGETSP